MVADLSQQNNNTTAQQQSVSTFEFGFGSRDQEIFINYVCWRPDMSHLTWAIRVER